MCGRYLIDDETYSEMWKMLNSEFGIKNPDMGATQNSAKGEIFPTNIAPVITSGGASADISIQGCKWGFPHWKGAGVIINARAETAYEKNIFRKPLLERRCVIPSGGFYEWSRVGGKKTKDKYLLRRPEESVLFMAGIQSIFRDGAGDEYSAFVILTTAANESVSPIHDRMPVILAADEHSRWIKDGAFAEHALRRRGPILYSQIAD